jgi:uncharacterized membrane protein
MKSRLVAALLWIAVFLLGAIAGATSHYLYWEHLKASYTPASPPTHEDIVEWMAGYLKLDEQQTESLKVIFDKSRQRYIDLAEEFRPRYETIRIETDDQIKSILREDQRKRFEEFLKKVQSMMVSPPREEPGQ